jgi:hypothetical protein
MFKKTVETSATPHITITECKGNLVVRGSEDRRITLRLKGGPDDWDLEQQGEAFTLQVRTGCHLTCPPDTTLAVDTVRGNLRVEELAGPVTIRTVHGNANLRSVGPVALDQTFGNLCVHKVAGDLGAQTTRGNARARQVEGSISMGRVDGNLGIEDLQGGLAIDQVGGDVQLGALFATDRAYRLATNGNLVIRVPSNASLGLNLRAGGGVRSQVPGLVLEKTDGEVRGVLGSGEANLEADVAGNISVRPWETDQGAPMEGMPWELAAEVEGLGRQIETHIAEAMAEMESRLEESLGRIDSEQIQLQVERAREQALRTAGRAAERARQTAEREAERARLRAERAERRWQRASGRRPRPKREPVTDEERMRVLRMVEEGKLAPEQAADLLAALEGR